MYLVSIAATMQSFRTLSLIAFGALLPIAVSAGVIDEAKPLTESLLDILNFCLSIFGVLAIIGMVIAGLLYFTAAGDERQMLLAKKAFWAGVVGIVIALGGMVLVWTVTTLLG